MSRIKNISILLPKGAATLTCIEGSFFMFNRVNEFLVSMGKPPMFNVKMVGLTTDPVSYQGVFSVIPDLSVHDSYKHDLIIIPPVNGEWESIVEMNKEFFPWVSAQYKSGSEIASLCVGAFLLASTGLMNGKSCATHWFAANDFRKMFPEINLVSEKIITDENGIYTSGGANSFWNLLLYIVEKYAGREIMLLCAKMYEIEIDRGSQASFSIFTGQKDHLDEPVKKAQEFIENHFQDRLTVEQLADMFALGRRSLERRFKKATNNTVVEYIQRVKIEAAKKSFESSRKNINEVMYEVGYSDTKAFRTIFKKIAGLSPIEYRNRYNKEMLAA
ncbi:GlxA family transcriptional regulator [Aurantibacillus circumpalustris]|uniref:GlxA family transcriptional regulator n=1 Tax=Aurantibacillus circumpalustris TaxID=3036359 RepID=UPI00295A649D|nr:helix-turn-helix domain-containing protein [Aurantibacillus circumpalustris]